MHNARKMNAGVENAIDATILVMIGLYTLTQLEWQVGQPPQSTRGVANRRSNQMPGSATA